MPIEELTCGGCGAPLDAQAVRCGYCSRAIVLTSFRRIDRQDAADLKTMAELYARGNAARAVAPGMSGAPDAGSLNFSAGACYLKLRLYDKALAKFEAAIEDNLSNPEAYFYAAVAMLKGKKAFLSNLPTIRKAIEYTEAACSMEQRGIFRYFIAYLKYDFFARKFLRITPDYREELAAATTDGVTGADAALLFDLLGVEIPEPLRG